MTQEELIILYLHGWQSVPGGVKPAYLRAQGATVIEPALPADDYEASLQIARMELGKCNPALIIGSSRGGSVAMNIDSGVLPLVLLAPAWKRWGTVNRVKPGTLILHSEADDVIAFADSLELLDNSGLERTALIATGNEHRLADPDSLRRLWQAVQTAAGR